MKSIALKNFRIIDAYNDFHGSVFVEDGIIKNIAADNDSTRDADIIIEGRGFGSSAVLMPSFIDLHAHFREPGFPEKETLESASLAAIAGGFTTVVCMANTNPVIDAYEKALALKTRSNALALIDLYPVMSLTKNMEGKELSGIKDLITDNASGSLRLPLMLSEDGKDVADDNLFLAAMKEAKRLGLPISCHCDFGGTESRAVNRAIELGKKAGCHIHIAHVSTKESLEIIRKTKNEYKSTNGFCLSCEAAPHHIACTEEDARRMGEGSFGRVNPSLSSEEDRLALIAGICDGTIDAIATDHAPHSEKDKIAGAPGFSGLETAFGACLEMVQGTALSAAMSANPAKILGLQDRGFIKEGLRADFIIADCNAVQTVDPQKFKSKGKCTPFAGRKLKGKILMTINAGRIVFTGDKNV